MSEIDTEKRQKAQTVSPDTGSGRDVFDEAYAGKICDSAVELEEAGRFREASKKYLIAGLAGDPEGAYGYAKSLYMGWTGEQDLRTAYEIFLMLRARGYRKSSCFFLGLYEEQGLLGKADPQKAISYYTEGGLDGDYRSYRQLGRIYAEGRLVEENPEKAYYNFMMAGAIGDPISVTNMALYVEEGYGVEKNLEWAVKLYKLAAGAGEQNAVEALERLGVEWEDDATASPDAEK